MSEQPDIDKLDSNFKLHSYPPPDGQPIQATHWQNNQLKLFNKGIFHNIYLQYLPSRIQVLYNIRILENLIKSICPECKGMIQTKLTYVSGCLSISLCILMCAQGLFYGYYFNDWFLISCCFIPFCMNFCKRQVHQCTLCEQILGEVN